MLAIVGLDITSHEVSGLALYLGSISVVLTLFTTFRVYQYGTDSIDLSFIANHWSFVEKTSVKQDPKPQVCSNFQMSFLHFS